MVPTTCSVDACDGPKFCKGFCTKHYQRNAKYGTPTPYKPSERERFWAKVVKGTSDGCWLWQGGFRGDYGFFNIPPTTIGAHKYAYIDAHGPVPEGLYVDHICHVPACVNPSHLQAVTPKQNNENHSGPTRRSASGIRGVWWDPTNKRWVGQVGHGGIRISAGHHHSREEAAAAVVELRKSLHTNNIRDWVSA